jgi:hypothetical protein
MRLLQFENETEDIEDIIQNTDALETMGSLIVAA